MTLDDSEDDFKWDDLGDTVLAYVKARGQHRNVNLTGSIMTERSNENEKFYAAGVTQMDVLAGNVDHHTEDTFALFEVVKMAEGRIDIDHRAIAKLAQEAAPGDANLTTPHSTPASPMHNFGIPDAGDPDPFGVLALEMAGLEIREAGTKIRPTSSQLGVGSNPASPTTSRFGSISLDTRQSTSNRGSYMSSHTIRSQVTDAQNQASERAVTPETTPSPTPIEVVLPRPSIDQMAEVKEEDEVEEEADDMEDASYASVDAAALEHISPRGSRHMEDETITNVLSALQRQDNGNLKATTEFDRASSHYERSDAGLDDNSVAGDDVEVLDAGHTKQSGEDDGSKNLGEEFDNDKNPEVEENNQDNKELEDDGDKKAAISGTHEEEMEEEKGEDEDDSDDLDDLDDLDDDDLDDDDEEPVVFEVASVQPARTQIVTPQVVAAKGSMVTIPKRLPPPLPTRSPARMSRSSKSELGDVSHLRSLSIQSVQTMSSGHLTLDAASRSGSPLDDQLIHDRPSSRTSRTSANTDGGASDIVKDTISEDTGENESANDQERKVSISSGNISSSDTTSTIPVPQYRLEVSKPAVEDPGLRDIRNYEMMAKFENEEQSEDSELGSPKHNPSSVCTDTGLTEDHWSVDDSSLTTPTSDRHFSTSDEAEGQDTPTKTLSAIGEHGVLALKSPVETKSNENMIKGAV